MRDPGRIYTFCNKLAAIWSKVPDWRFGQLIVNAMSELGRDPFYVEEPQMLEFLDGYVRRIIGEKT